MTMPGIENSSDELPLIRCLDIKNYDATLFKENWTMSTFQYPYFTIPLSPNPRTSVFNYLEQNLPKLKNDIFKEYINFMKTFRTDDLYHDLF